MTCCADRRQRRAWAATGPALCLAACLLLGAATAAPAAPGDESAGRWRPTLGLGYDASVHNYPLAGTDTTETVAEFQASAGLEGRSAAGGRRSWLLRAEGSAGSELFREHLQGQVRWFSGGRRERGRLDAEFRGRQVRHGADAFVSSDSAEGRLEGRLRPLAGPDLRLEMRGWAARRRYVRPSTLEVDQDDAGGGLLLTGAGSPERTWTLGTGLARRTYPDSSGLDRTVLAADGSWSAEAWDATGVRLYHRSERTLVRDRDLRPAAWSHWTEAAAAVAAAPGLIFLELQSEVRRYDRDFSAYFDSWLAGGWLGYRWGGVLATGWRLGVVGERLAAGEAPEAYTQVGVRGAVESFGSRLCGSLTAEFGNRGYDAAPAVLPDLESPPPEEGGLDLAYSDFHYWKLWLTGSWRLGGAWSLEVLASYEPESHTEPLDDSALGFCSARLLWRP